MYSCSNATSNTRDFSFFANDWIESVASWADPECIGIFLRSTQTKVRLISESCLYFKEIIEMLSFGLHILLFYVRHPQVITDRQVWFVIRRGH